MTEVLPEDAEAFESHLAARSASSLRLEAALGILLIPLFWLIDLAVMPEFAGVTAGIRGACVLTAAALLLYHRRAPLSFARQSDNLAFAFTQMVAASISVMCWLHAGLESPYYAGLSLLVVSVAFFFVWSWRRSVTFYLLIYAFYMLPLLTGWLSVEHPEAVLTNQAFLLSIILVAAVSQKFRFELERSDFMAQLSVQRARVELQSALEKLKALDQAKNEFFGNLTHELRTPMTMILSPIEVMLQSSNELTEAQETTLALVRRNALKLLKLINDLLDLSKMEEQFLRLSLQRVEPTELMAEIVNFSRPLAARKDIEVTLTTNGEIPQLHIDPEKLERAVVNLLSNALKFTDEGGAVGVHLRADDEEVIIEISDSGIGIPEDKFDEIFERFSQADASTTRKYGGTGIGLAFSKRIVDLHGGRITVASEVGLGSTFSIHLQIGKDHYTHDLIDRRQRDRGAVVEKRSDDKGPREWSRKIIGREDYRFLDIAEVTERRLVRRGDDAGKESKLVVVEDNVSLLQFVHSQLAETYAVYVATNGRQGLDLIRRERPDLVVTDYMMPEMDGIELITSIREDSDLAQTPLIMLTAKSGLEDRLAGRGAGADAYLAKPFEMLELLAVVERLLERKQHQQSEVRSAQIKSLELISSGLAHEIHNPLSFVKNAHFVISERARKILDALESEASISEETRQKVAKPAARIDKMLEVSERGIARIEHIVALVRSYAREGYPMSGVPLQFDELVRNVVDTAIEIPEGVEFALRLGAGQSQTTALRSELSQVFRNLMQNALDAVAKQDGGRVDVATVLDGAYLSLEVRDNGPGIPEDDLEKIFTPFFSTKPTSKGMGLGLAIAHQVTQSCGGEIVVRNQESGGAWFTVRVPVSSPSPEP